MSSISLLDNIFWHALSGPHTKYSVGTDKARRYTLGFSPLVGFLNPEDPDFNALLPFCSPEERLYCDGWSGALPGGWRLELESTMFKMIWENTLPEELAIDAVPLGPEHALQAYALATLTRPGPFGPRTIELGDYFGCFDGPNLIAMAGERTHAGSLREISGVCTHPDYQGRGFARRLMVKLMRRQMQRGETPCLHVMRDNRSAHEFYLRMGFRDYKESAIRAIARY